MRNLVRDVAGWLSFGSESGVTAIEYGLIAALIAISILTSVTQIGTLLAGIAPLARAMRAAPGG
jgi:pilus assembly protein Flp/PilA